MSLRSLHTMASGQPSQRMMCSAMSETSSTSSSATSSTDASILETLGLEPSDVFLQPFPIRSVKNLSPSSSLCPEEWRRYASDMFMTETYPPSFDEMKGKGNEFGFPIFNFDD